MKRPKHLGRILAHEQFRKARVALENFLVSIEAPNDSTFDEAQAGFANRTESVPLERAQEPEEGPEVGNEQPHSNRASRAVDRLPNTAISPTVKRRAHAVAASNLERKRIKFCENIEERPEYRGTLEYYRGAKEYVPGRYAVSEGTEYEDTSGSTISFAKFTGQKKIGSTFVDIVPKEEAEDGGEGSSAVKKRGKGSGKRDLGLTDNLEVLEKDESQMNSRELRLSRRARLTIPPAAVKPRRVSAQYGGHEGTSPEASDNATSLVVSLKVPTLPKDHALINRDIPTPYAEEMQRASDNIGINQTTVGATEPAVIREAVSNIQRELRHLQQTMITSTYVDMVSKAMRGCFQALEPLEHLDLNQPRQNKDLEEAREEEKDSIYSEASDRTNKPTLTTASDIRRHDPSNRVEIVPEWTEATLRDQESSKPDFGLALDVNTLDDMPKEGKQDLSGTLDPDKTEHDKSAGINRLSYTVELLEEKGQQT
ncbi:hypothetical protein N0V86_000707 [Didymella sp. IMI 355093]|nr:hypothetical protein N0V86_000707 [Didymella sp. IMI 355093]